MTFESFENVPVRRSPYEEFQTRVKEETEALYNSAFDGIQSWARDLSRMAETISDKRRKAESFLEVEDFIREIFADLLLARRNRLVFFNDKINQARQMEAGLPIEEKKAA